ncbi:MAG: glutaredoxin domain-containing protein [Bdellovibrionota bacterium]
MKPVIVYTAPSCPYCVQAKELLKRRAVPFQEILIGWDDEAGWKEAEKRSGMKTMPQIFIDGKIVGGYTELAALDRSGELATLLA